MREAVEGEFNRQVKEKDTWFYQMRFEGEEFFVNDTTQLAMADCLP